MKFILERILTLEGFAPYLSRSATHFDTLTAAIRHFERTPNVDRIDGVKEYAHVLIYDEHDYHQNSEDLEVIVNLSPTIGESDAWTEKYMFYKKGAQILSAENPNIHNKEI